MLTPQQRRQFQEADAALDGATEARLADLLAGLRITDPQEFTAGVFDTLPGLVGELSDVSAVIAAEMYETARDQADARGRFVVDLSDPPPVEQVETTTRWALAPMFDPENLLAGADLLVLVRDRLEAGSTRLVRDGGRRTITDNAGRDPAQPRYKRVLSAGRAHHCDFCVMLAGRGFVYHSEDTAGAATHFHDRCHCGMELGFKGQ